VATAGQKERHAAWRDDQPHAHRVKSYEVTIAAPPEALAQADRALARAGIRSRLILVSGLGGDDPKAKAIVVGIVGEEESDAERAVRDALPAVCRYTLTVAVGPARWRSSCPARPPPGPSSEKALWSKDPGSGRL
jgi:hypothetical protein